MKGLFPTPPPDSSVLPCGQHKNVASPCAMLDHLVRRKSLQPGTAVGSWWHVRPILDRASQGTGSAPKSFSWWTHHTFRESHVFSRVFFWFWIEWQPLQFLGVKKYFSIGFPLMMSNPKGKTFVCPYTVVFFRWYFILKWDCQKEGDSGGYYMILSWQWYIHI